MKSILDRTRSVSEWKLKRPLEAGASVNVLRSLAVRKMESGSVLTGRVDWRFPHRFA